MKVKMEETKINFKPFKVSLIFETREEAEKWKEHIGNQCEAELPGADVMYDCLNNAIYD